MTNTKAFEIRDLLYEGKAKKIFSTDSADYVLMEFKNDLTAFNALKKGQFEGKGQINCQIASILFSALLKHNISSHLVRTIEPNKMLVKKTQIIPLEVVVRNRIAGSLAKKFKIVEGEKLKKPLLEFYFKNDELQDPFVSDDQITAFEWATEDDLKVIKEITFKINDILLDIFLKCQLLLIDFKIEFGKLPTGEIILSDEISPDSMRLWDINTNEKMDKDRFRLDLGDVKQGYQFILKQLKEAHL
jgi:phosphoribosylaminoimidazole-succinocarboxamide synthase